MKRILILLFLISGSVSAQNSLLWEISGPALEKPSYLFGTMHLQDSRAFEFGDSVMPKFYSCGAVALEMLQDFENIFLALGAMMLPEGDSLKNHMKAKEYIALKEYVDANMGLMASLVDVMKPIFVSVLISESFADKDVAQPLDLYLQHKGTEAEKIMIGLESMDEQMAALDAIKIKDQVKMIMDQLDDMEGTEKMMDDLIVAYQKQDLGEVSRLMNDADMPKYVNKALIVDRNLVMAHRIDSIIRLQSTFVAVGAGHLPNEDGLISLLKMKGYQVKPIISQYNPKENKLLSYGTWEYFHSKIAAFQVEMPAKPQVTIDTIESEYGQVVYRMFMYEDKENEVFFSVSSMLLPPEQIEEDGDKYFENAVLRMAENTGAKVLNSERLNIKGLEGIEAEFQALPGVHFRLRVFLTGQRSHILMMGGPPAELYGESGNRFLDSFDLIK